MTIVAAGQMDWEDRYMRVRIHSNIARFPRCCNTSAIAVQPSFVVNLKTFQNNIKLLSDTGLTFDLCVLPHQLLIATELVDYCPQVIFILNHCGVPDIKNGNFSPWNDFISALAKRPNVIAKISGLIAYGDPKTWNLDSIRPYFDHTVEAFGHSRIIWGSDSPVCNLGGGLETWVASTHALTADWSLDQRRCFYQGNAKNIWAV